MLAGKIYPCPLIPSTKKILGPKSYTTSRNILQTSCLYYYFDAFLNDVIAFCTAQEMKFSIKDFFSKCDKILSFLRIWSHLLKKLLMENFIFCALKPFNQSKTFYIPGVTAQKMKFSDKDF